MEPDEIKWHFHCKIRFSCLSDELVRDCISLCILQRKEHALAHNSWLPCSQVVFWSSSFSIHLGVNGLWVKKHQYLCVLSSLPSGTATVGSELVFMEWLLCFLKVLCDVAPLITLDFPTLHSWILLCVLFCVCFFKCGVISCPWKHNLWQFEHAAECQELKYARTSSLLSRCIYALYICISCQALIWKNISMTENIYIYLKHTGFKEVCFFYYICIKYVLNCVYFPEA